MNETMKDNKDMVLKEIARGLRRPVAILGVLVLFKAYQTVLRIFVSSYVLNHWPHTIV